MRKKNDFIIYGGGKVFLVQLCKLTSKRIQSENFALTDSYDKRDSQEQLRHLFVMALNFTESG